MPNHLVLAILDSCRYDSFVSAKTPHLDRLGEPERRYSFASWTAPSHYAFLMGLMPHRSPRGIFASEVYKEAFKRWVDRLGIADLSFRNFVPELSLPKVLADLGYHCTARVSLPVLNPQTGINRHFHDYRLMNDHNDFAGMVREIQFDGDQPQFYFLNLGETHYPYMLADKDLPHISGVHGVFKNLDDQKQTPSDRAGEGFFDMDRMRELHAQQVSCVEYVDRWMGELFAKCPPNTHIIVTSDHGELFGEDGYFGHGPVMHEKCFEVPYVEGRVPQATSD